MELVPVDLYVAVACPVGDVVAGQHFYQSALAGAVVPDQGVHFASRHVQVDRLQRALPPEGLVERADGYRRPRLGREIAASGSGRLGPGAFVAVTRHATGPCTGPGSWLHRRRRSPAWARWRWSTAQS